MITYTYKIRPTKAQEVKLLETLDLTRKLYNDGLRELIDHYEKIGKYLHRYDHDKLHNSKRHPTLQGFVVDETLNRLHKSFADFFRGIREKRKVGFPRFKSQDRWHSFSSSCSGGLTLRGTLFYAGKKMGGKIRVNVTRPLQGNQKISRILKKPSGWYLQIVTDYEKPKLEPNTQSIGLDFGIKNLVADSEGNFVENPQFLKQSLKKLRIAQRSKDRRKIGSNRRKKATQVVSNVYEIVHNQRLDYYHKVTRRYVNDCGLIVIEDLKPSNMIKNHNLARSIMDSSWGMLRNLLEVKAAEAGRQVIAVPPHYTSQKCSKCGEIVQKSLSVRTHSCPCGYIDDRDVNAAKNILGAGLALQALTYGTSQRVA